MANHPNRNWKRRWTVDQSAGTAVHESGLRARFVRFPSGEWHVDVDNGPLIVVSLSEAGEPHAQARVERWIWEASELFRRALERQETGHG